MKTTNSILNDPLFASLFPAFCSWQAKGKIKRSQGGWSHTKFSQMLAKRPGWGVRAVGLWSAWSTHSHSLSNTSSSTWPRPPRSPPRSLSFSLSFFSPPSRCLSGSLRLAANNAGVVRYHRLLLLRRVEAAQRLSSKRQTPVFCHSFDSYPSLLRTSRLCLPLRHSPRSDL